MAKFLFLMVAVLLSAGVVAGQDDAACTADNMRNLLDLTTGQIEAMREAAEVDDLETYLLNGALLRALLSGIDAVCRGLSFSSEADGMMPVIGPVVFAQNGVYRATVVTDGFFIATLTPVSGTCEPGNRGRGLFNFGPREGQTQVETILTAEGCMTLLEIKNVTQPWTLEFEMLIPADE